MTQRPVIETDSIVNGRHPAPYLPILLRDFANCIGIATSTNQSRQIVETKR
jgi:hypothetical protein